MIIEYERNSVVMPGNFLPLFDVTEHKDIITCSFVFQDFVSRYKEVCFRYSPLIFAAHSI